MDGIPLLAIPSSNLKPALESKRSLFLAPPGEWDSGSGRTGEAARFPKVSAPSSPVRSRRQDSGICRAEGPRLSYDIVLIHDGARPFVTPDLIDRVITETRVSKAIVAAIPVPRHDERGRRRRNRLENSESGSPLEIQTPQGFLYSLLLKAYEKPIRNQIYGTG